MRKLSSTWRGSKKTRVDLQDQLQRETYDLFWSLRHLSVKRGARDTAGVETNTLMRTDTTTALFLLQVWSNPLHPGMTSKRIIDD